MGEAVYEGECPQCGAKLMLRPHLPKRKVSALRNDELRQRLGEKILRERLSVRKVGRMTGVAHNVLGRFVNGRNIAGRSVERIRQWMELES